MSRRVNSALRKAGGSEGWLAALLMFLTTGALGVIFVGHGLAIDGFDGAVSVGLGLFCLLSAVGMVLAWVFGGDPDEDLDDVDLEEVPDPAAGLDAGDSD